MTLLYDIPNKKIKKESIPFEQSNKIKKNNWKYTTALTIGYHVWIMKIIFWLKTQQLKHSKTMSTKENTKLVINKHNKCWN